MQDASNRWLVVSRAANVVVSQPSEHSLRVECQEYPLMVTFARQNRDGSHRSRATDAFRRELLQGVECSQVRREQGSVFFIGWLKRPPGVAKGCADDREIIDEKCWTQPQTLVGLRDLLEQPCSRPLLILTEDLRIRGGMHRRLESQTLRNASDQIWMRVPELPSRSCRAFYVGSTGRNLADLLYQFIH